MVLQVLIIISIVLQLIAVVVAIRLISKTKYNISWMLFTLALMLLCVLRLAQYVSLVWGKEWQVPPHFYAWLGVVTSLCFAIGIFYVGKLINTTRQLNYQRRLTERRILMTVLRTEEKERLHFSKELHDGLGPLLSSAKMSLSELAKSEHKQDDVELIKNTSYVIEEAIRCLREISNNLSPHTLEAFGLAHAVTNFINKSTGLNNGGVKIKFATNLKSERFDSNVEVILYRVVCELITNSLRHSTCDNIELSMTYGNDEIKIHYADDGKGFELEAVLDTGMGLSNIVSRINSLKGNIEIHSARTKGMTADITVNMTDTDERDRKL